MAISKLILNGVTQMDVTGDTVASGNLLSGYTATGNDGQTVNGSYVAPVLGTKSITANGTYNASDDSLGGYSSVTVNVSGGGGGGVECETGTWTPASDVASYVINFSNTHNSVPFFYIIYDATGTYYDTSNSITFIEFTEYNQLGGDIRPSTSQIYYGVVEYQYRATNTGSFSTGMVSLLYPSSNTGDGTTSYARYWATETSIKAYTNSSSRYFRTGRTYKWIAFWKPTT